MRKELEKRFGRRERFLGTFKRFGGENLTKGVEHLFSLCKDCLVYDGHTISEVFELIRQGKVDTAKCRKEMKDEVSKRLNQIGYWDYVPIPRTEFSQSTKKQQTPLLADTVLG